MLREVDSKLDVFAEVRKEVHNFHRELREKNKSLDLSDP